MTDFKRMNKKELKHYLSTHRNDEEFSAALGERLSRRDPNAKKHSVNLTFEETGQIIHQKVKELNKNEKIVREKLKHFHRHYIEEISKPDEQVLINPSSQENKRTLISNFFKGSRKKLDLDELTNQKADNIRKLSKDIKDFVSDDRYRLSELKEYLAELEGLNELLLGRTSELAGDRLLIGGVGTFLAIVLTVFFRDVTPIFLEDVGISKHLIDLYNAVYIDSIAAIIVPIIVAFLVVWVIDSTNKELSSLNYSISHNKAFVVLAKHIYETESKNLKD